MKVKHLFVSAIRASLGKSVNRMLALLIPTHVKRAIFVLSIFRAYGTQREFDVTDLPTLKKIEHQFHLVSNGDARSLVLPAHITKLTVRCSKQQWYLDLLRIPRSQVYDRVYQSNSWLNWARTSDMVNEVMRVRRSLTDKDKLDLNVVSFPIQKTS